MSFLIKAADQFLLQSSTSCRLFLQSNVNLSKHFVVAVTCKFVEHMQLCVIIFYCVPNLTRRLPLYLNHLLCTMQPLQESSLTARRQSEYFTHQDDTQSQSKDANRRKIASTELDSMI